MTRIEVLSQELKGDPRLAGYNTMTDASVAEFLNKKSVVHINGIESSEIRRYLMLTGKWYGIRISDSPEAVTAIDALAEFESFDISDPKVKEALNAMLDGLISKNILTPGDKQAIFALAKKMISRAEELGIGSVTVADVAAARRLVNA